MRRLPLLPNGRHTHICRLCGHEEVYAPTRGCDCPTPDLTIPPTTCRVCMQVRTRDVPLVIGRRPATIPMRNVTLTDWVVGGGGGGGGGAGGTGRARTVTVHRHYCPACDAESARCDCPTPAKVWNDCPMCNQPPSPCACCKTRMVKQRGGLCWNCKLGHEPGRPKRLHLRRTHCDCCKDYCGTRMKGPKCGWCNEQCAQEGTVHITNGETTGKYHLHSCFRCGQQFICDKVPECKSMIDAECGFCNKPNTNAHRHRCRGVGAPPGCGYVFYCHVADRASKPQCWRCRNTRNQYQVKVDKTDAGKEVA